jgi:hypothetical protein
MSVTTMIVQVRLRIQLNSSLYAKTLVRKDVASATSASSSPQDDNTNKGKAKGSDESAQGKKDEDNFSSKAQIMTLMTTDVDRVSEFALGLSTLIGGSDVFYVAAIITAVILVDAPIEIVVGTFFLYKLMGISAFVGLAVSCIFFPLNHFAGKVVVGAQDNLMKARDERISVCVFVDAR